MNGGDYDGEIAIIIGLQGIVEATPNESCVSTSRAPDRRRLSYRQAAEDGRRDDDRIDITSSWKMICLGDRGDRTDEEVEGSRIDE